MVKRQNSHNVQVCWNKTTTFIFRHPTRELFQKWHNVFCSHWQNLAGKKSAERIQHTISTSHVLGKLSNYILVYALTRYLNTNVHIEYFQSFSCMCQETQLFLVKLSAVIFSFFRKKKLKKKIIYIYRDEWCLANARYKNLSKRKQISWQVWFFFSQKILKQLLWFFSSPDKIAAKSCISYFGLSCADLKITW